MIQQKATDDCKRLRYRATAEQRSTLRHQRGWVPWRSNLQLHCSLTVSQTVRTITGIGTQNPSFSPSKTKDVFSWVYDSLCGHSKLVISKLRWSLGGFPTCPPWKSGSSSSQPSPRLRPNDSLMPLRRKTPAVKNIAAMAARVASELCGVRRSKIICWSSQ